MADFQVCVGLFGLQRLFSGHLRDLIEVARMADEAGVDQLSLPDHVIMGPNTAAYPYGEFGMPPDAPWFEPMTMLAAMASVTRRIRLSTGVLIAPLRPAVLLAKQVATLDGLASGRLDVGIGVGWQREEYAAEGLDFDARWRLLDEGLRACRALWSESPVAHAVNSIPLQGLYSQPFPEQARIPIWLGVAGTARQAQRIAEYGDGWMPLELDRESLARGIDGLREAFGAVGRAPEELGVRAPARFELDSNHRGDLERSIDDARRLADLGVTHVVFVPSFYASNPDELARVFERLAAI